MRTRLFAALKGRVNRNRRPKDKKAVDKQEFIAILETTLLCADLDITALCLIDDNTAQITFKGGGTRRVNIGADSHAAIILDVMKHVF